MENISHFAARIPAEVWRNLKAMALAHDRSINAELVTAIKAAWADYVAEIEEEFGHKETDDATDGN